MYLAVCIDRRIDPGYHIYTKLEDAVTEVKNHCKNYLRNNDTLEGFEEKIWEYFCRPTEENYGYVRKVAVD